MTQFCSVGRGLHALPLSFVMFGRRVYGMLASSVHSRGFSDGVVQLEEAWIATVLFLMISAVLAAGVLLAARVLGVKSKRRTKLTLSTYECGEEPEGPAWLKFHPRYYVVALVFVLFDVEAVFLFTWALVLRELGVSAMVAMFVFIGVLLLGWVFALSKGALRWQ